MTNIPDLEDAVERCKAMVLERPDDSDEKKLLVRRLIELRLRLHDVKEAMKEEGTGRALLNRTVVLGHHFIRQNHPKSLSTHYCDRCSGVIWNAMHSWHLCSGMDLLLHILALADTWQVCFC